MLNQPISSPIITRIFGFFTDCKRVAANELVCVCVFVVVVVVVFVFVLAFAMVTFAKVSVFENAARLLSVCTPTAICSAREKFIIDFATPDMYDLLR